MKSHNVEMEMLGKRRPAQVDGHSIQLQYESVVLTLLSQRVLQSLHDCFITYIPLST